MRNLLTSILISILFVSCGGSGTGNNANSNNTETSQSSISKTPKTKWAYRDQVDEMTDSKTYYAQIEAEDEMEFSFPYNGGTKVWLIIRKSDSKEEVLLSISKNKGQFMPNVLDDRSVLVRFDDKTAEKYGYTEPSDFSSETIFIKNPKKFIDNLKASQKIIVQCDFFNEGTRTIKFDTQGFEWNH